MLLWVIIIAVSGDGGTRVMDVLISGIYISSGYQKGRWEAFARDTYF